jgi:hypothetical protein
MPVIFYTWIGGMLAVIPYMIIDMELHGSRICSKHGLIIFILIGAIIGGAAGSLADYRQLPPKDIYSIGDSMNIEGMFVLGCGNVDGEPVFSFYKDAGNGGYKLDYVYAKYTTIYEDAEGINGYIEGAIGPMGSNIQYSIHVPKGTIKRTYILDGI